jgi:TnpA family transposase
MPRMTILSAAEQEAFESPPVFNSVQRKHYFDLPLALRRLATSLRAPTHEVCFLLICGYFKATKKFFALVDFRPRDIDYVAQQLDLSPEDVVIADYTDRTRQRHQRLILKYYGFHPFDPQVRGFLAEEITRMVRSQLKPKLMFWRCVDRLVQGKMEVPSYFRLADLILSAINSRNRELSAIIERLLDQDTKALLDALLTQEAAADGTAPGKTSAYKLTLLKKLSQSTKPSKVKERTGDSLLIEGLYERLQPVLAALALNPDGLRYYAHGVIKAEIFQTTRRDDDDRYLHLIAFIAHQYYRLQDNLVDVLLTSLASYQNSAQREHKEQCYARRAQRNQSLKALVGYLDEDLLKALAAIRTITDEPHLSAAEKVDRIRALLATQDANRHHAKLDLTRLKRELERELSEDDYYRILEAKSIRLQNRISPIIKALTFQGEPSARPLLAAIQYFKDKDGLVDKAAPLGFLAASERAAVTAGGKVRVSLYKALLFLHIQNAIKSGTLNLDQSYKYRPLDDYLIARERWHRDKEVLLERAGLQAAASPRPVRAELDEQLYAQYVTTNHHIQEGKNPFIKFGQKGAFSLTTPKAEESDAESLQHFFPERYYVALLEVLATVNCYSDFLNELQHWQQRYHHGRPPERTFYAGIMALGFGIGIRKMARISNQINESELEHTVNWYFSVENTHATNDQVLRLIDRLELPNLYRRSPDRLHTSSDGQKFEVHLDSLNANYSFKYFGKGQGVTVYSFRDERDLLWHSTVFSSGERESAYVIDGLMHNDVVKSDIHSTDSAGFSEAIFGIAYLLGFSYAPRFKNLKRQKRYIFKSRRNIDRSSWKIKPNGYIDTDLIEQNWDDILRLIATLKLKEVTASDLFRRLNSYSQQHAVYRASKTFGKIIKSLFILHIIDDVELRQAIERQLAKIEHAHRFTRAVSVGNPREFIQAEKQEQEIAEGCKRLLKNCIICWNYLYLSQKLADIDDPKVREAFLQAVASGSVVTWRHINLMGEYDFSDEKLRDSVGIKPPKLMT